MKVALSVHGTNPGSRARLREIVHELARPIERRLGSLQKYLARLRGTHQRSRTPIRHRGQQRGRTHVMHA